MACRVGVDDWLFSAKHDVVNTSHPGRMAPETALCFILLATALSLIKYPVYKNYAYIISIGMALLVLSLALAALLTYFTPQLGHYGWLGLTVMAIHTAALFTLLAIAVIQINWQHHQAFWSLDNKTSLAFACAVFLLINIGINLSRAQYWLAEINHDIVLNDQMVGDMENIVANVINTQTNNRGYVITSDDRFLKSYVAMEADTLQKLQALRKLDFNAKNPQHKSQFILFETLVKTQFDWQQQVIAGKQAGMNDAVRNTMVRQGADLLDTLLSTFTQIKNWHQASIAKQRQELAAVSKFSYFSTFVGTFISLLIFLIAILKLNAVVNTHNIAEAEKELNRERMQAFLKLGQMYNQSIDEIEKFVIENSVQQTSSEMGLCGLLDENLEEMTTQVWSDKTMQECAVVGGEFSPQLWTFSLKNAGLWAEAVRRCEPVIVNDYATLAEGKRGTPPGHIQLRRFLRMPVMHEGKPIAVIGVANKVAEYTDSDVFHLRLLAEGLRRALCHYHDQQALQHSEITFRGLFNSVSDAIYIMSAEGNFLDVNASVVAMYQYPKDFFIGNRLESISANDKNAMPAIDAALQKAFAGEPQQFEFWGKRSNGEVFPKEVHLTQGLYFGQQVVIALAHDITHRKKAEATLRETNAYLENLLDYANAPIIVWDPHFRITRFNNAFEFLTGRHEAEVIGQSLELLFPPALIENSMALIRKTLSGERWEAVEIEIQHRDESIRTVLWNSATLFAADGKTPIATIAQGQDITERKQAENRVREQQRLLVDSQTVAHIGSWMTEIGSFKIMWSEETFRLYGLSPNPEGYIGFEQFFELLHPDDIGIMQDWIAECMSDKPMATLEFRINPASGINRWLLGCGSLEKSADGTPFRMIGTVQDITERKKVENDLRIAAIAFESQEGISITDAVGTILRVNQAFCEETGYSPEEIIGKNSRILKSGRHSTEFYIEMWKSIYYKGAWKGEIWSRRKNGEIYPEYLTITAVKDARGNIINYVATSLDITVSKAAAEEIERLAFYDPLTDLPNRLLLRDRLKSAVLASNRSGKKGALLFIDMDNFKNLNDTLGHDVGDLLLQQVGERLTHCLRDNDTAARLGGDEFVVVLEDLSEQAEEAATQTEVIATKILTALQQSYQLATHLYYSSSSIGATVFTGHKKDADELLKQADIAMYQAKNAGRNTLRFFDPQMQAAINARAALDADLRLAVTEKQFKLYYQAQVHHDGSIIGAEVLVRWQHPSRGLVSPADFIPLAEENGLILAVGQWVLETACAQIKDWKNNLATQHLQLAVNVSARQFRQSDFVAQVFQVLQDTKIKPSLLKLELTESLVLDDINDTIEKMNALRKIGVRFSMDDFGTGYSSLAYLTQLPLDQLKIDQSFVRNIGVKRSDAVIVQTIIGMANNLGMEVIAEGVETEAQRAFLEQHVCLICQGYLFSKPVPVSQFEALIEKV